MHREPGLRVICTMLSAFVLHFKMLGKKGLGSKLYDLIRNHTVLHDQRYKLPFLHFSTETELSTLLDPP